MRKVCAIMVPKNLPIDQKDDRKNKGLNFIDRIVNEPNFCTRVITGVESWIFEYDPESKRL